MQPAFRYLVLSVLCVGLPAPSRATTSQLGPAIAQESRRTIRGTVHDQMGYVVPGAHIVIQATGYERATTSGNVGAFRVEGAPREKLRIAVDASGFARYTGEVAERTDEIEVVLLPATVAQEINVTANRIGTSQGDTPESIEVLSRRQMDAIAGASVDQSLRLVPGFTLFRRSDSRTANPTSQGDSLRGIGGNGASRALVLYDGVPLNDPFGGWVYWGRITRQELSAVEVLRGGGSSLYGSGALSGVVNLVPQREPRNLLSAEFSMGSKSTPDLSLANNIQIRSWTINTSGEAFRSDGYVVVPAGQRGSVDTPVNSYHGEGQVVARRKFARGDFFSGGEFYDEARNNGTLLQTNDTQLWQISSGLNLLTRLASLELRAYGSGQSYNQTFSSVAADRNSESLTRAQHVPAQQAGGDLTLSRLLGARNQLVGGADVRSVRGFSNETAFASSITTSLVDSGGYQLTSGAFLQDSIRLHSRLLFTLGARYDNWDNYNAHTSTTPLVPTIKKSFTAFAGQSDHAFSPRAALLFRAGDRVTLAGSWYESFRAPTLNELYRSFRLGNVLTLANSQLQAERLKGGEAGVNYYFGDTRIHTGFFWMQISDPVANVTLSTTPALITRERENLGKTRSRGVEVDAAWRIKRLEFIAGYQYVDAVVTSFPAQTALVGLQVPQVAPNQFTLQTRYTLPRGWTLSAQARASSRQFDDDLNQFPLDSYFQLDAYVAKRLGHGVEVFTAVENLSDSRTQIAKTPTVNIGPPIFARAGVKLHWE
jgi:outer membrane receptor protein involved in Fe transport